MPDIDTGQQGTGVVNVIKLQTDVDRNGIMDKSFAGPDNTSQARPLVWWINNDCDWSTSSSDPGEDSELAMQYPNIWADYLTHYIRSQRDLEDWARLWICGVPVLTSGYQVTLSWANVSSGSPAINLVNAVETNGGTLYLTDPNVGAAPIGVKIGVRTNFLHIPAPGLDTSPRWGDSLAPGLWLASSEFSILERSIT